MPPPPLPLGLAAALTGAAAVLNDTEVPLLNDDVEVGAACAGAELVLELDGCGAVFDDDGDGDGDGGGGGAGSAPRCGLPVWLPW